MGDDGQFTYLRKVDFASASSPTVRSNQGLLEPDSGSDNSSIRYISTPPGDGSPAGLHTHEIDQIFYILEGKMNLEIDGKEFEAEPGTLVVFPAGVPHRNWNGGSTPTVHLAINASLLSRD